MSFRNFLIEQLGGITREEWNGRLIDLGNRHSRTASERDNAQDALFREQDRVERLTAKLDKAEQSFLGLARSVAAVLVRPDLEFDLDRVLVHVGGTCEEAPEGFEADAYDAVALTTINVIASLAADVIVTGETLEAYGAVLKAHGVDLDSIETVDFDTEEERAAAAEAYRDNGFGVATLD